MLLGLFVFLFFTSSIFGQNISVKNKFQNGDFPLVYKNLTAEIFVSNEDFKVVRIATIMNKYYRLGFQRKPEHLQWFIPKETPRKSDFTEMERLERLADYADLRKLAEAIFAKISPSKKDAFYELVLYPVRSAMLANEQFFAAELAEIYKSQNRADAIIWARKSIVANDEIRRETEYFNEKPANGKWRFTMSPEMNAGQWSSMRSTPPILSETDFQSLSNQGKTEEFSILNVKKPLKGFTELNGVISMEAENFTRRNDKNFFAWQTIEGLGKTGDSVSVFPQKAQTFTDFLKNSPSLEYQFYVSNAGVFEANFFLIPTQPLVAGNGLRFAVSIADETPQIIIVDKDTDVSSPKWANNVLNQTTVGKSSFKLTKGTQVLKIFAVDTGVVLDKIVLSSGELKPSYLAPTETRIH